MCAEKPQFLAGLVIHCAMHVHVLRVHSMVSNVYRYLFECRYLYTTWMYAKYSPQVYSGSQAIANSQWESLTNEPTTHRAHTILPENGWILLFVHAQRRHSFFCSIPFNTITCSTTTTKNIVQINEYSLRYTKKTKGRRLQTKKKKSKTFFVFGASEGAPAL